MTRDEERVESAGPRLDPSTSKYELGEAKMGTSAYDFPSVHWCAGMEVLEDGAVATKVCAEELRN